MIKPRDNHYDTPSQKLSSEEVVWLGQRKNVAGYKWIKNRMMSESHAYMSGRTYYRSGLLGEI